VPPRGATLHWSADAFDRRVYSSGLVRDARLLFAKGVSIEAIADRLGGPSIATITQWIEGRTRIRAGGPIVRKVSR
jgi:hypothetical protein